MKTLVALIALMSFGAYADQTIIKGVSNDNKTSTDSSVDLRYYMGAYGNKRASVIRDLSRSSGSYSADGTAGISATGDIADKRSGIGDNGLAKAVAAAKLVREAGAWNTKFNYNRREVALSLGTPKNDKTLKLSLDSKGKAAFGFQMSL